MIFQCIQTIKTNSQRTSRLIKFDLKIMAIEAINDVKQGRRDYVEGGGLMVPYPAHYVDRILLEAF